MRNRDTQPAQSQKIGQMVEKGGKRFRRDASPYQSQMLGSDVDDFEFDEDDPYIPNVKYCIQKEEYPPELLRAFDIV